MNELIERARKKLAAAADRAARFTDARAITAAAVDAGEAAAELAVEASREGDGLDWESAADKINEGIACAALLAERLRRKGRAHDIRAVLDTANALFLEALNVRDTARFILSITDSDLTSDEVIPVLVETGGVIHLTPNGIVVDANAASRKLLGMLSEALTRERRTEYNITPVVLDKELDSCRVYATADDIWPTGYYVVLDDDPDAVHAYESMEDMLERAPDELGISGVEVYAAYMDA